MTELLTMTDIPTGERITLPGGRFAVKRFYSQEDVGRFCFRGEEWDLRVEKWPCIMEFSENPLCFAPLRPEHFVISGGALAGFFYDSCFFDFADKGSYQMTCHRRDDSGMIPEGVVTTTYTLMPRPRDRMLYSEDGTVLLSCPKDYEGPCKLPGHVKRIAGWAFRDCKKLTAVYMSNSVECIEENAFCNCDSLEQLSIPNGTMVHRNAFQNCKKPKSLTIPHSVTDLYYAGERVTEYRTEDHPLFSTVDGVLFNKEMTHIYAYPTDRQGKFYRVDRDVRSIGNSAFRGNSCLTRVAFHDALETIGDYAFAGTGLESVALMTGLKKLGKGAFSGCKNLMTLSVSARPEGAIWEAFPHCDGLRTICLPKELEELDPLRWREGLNPLKRPAYRWMDHVTVSYSE